MDDSGLVSSDSSCFLRYLKRPGSADKHRNTAPRQNETIRLCLCICWEERGCELDCVLLSINGIALVLISVLTGHDHRGGES
jgi:hypothetical protein